MSFREETDTMGTVLVPEDAYYGPQTQRAAENFPISGLVMPEYFIHSLALIKRCAAQVIGNDTTITFGGQAGNFELNVMLPVIAYNLLQSITLLSAAADALVNKCIKCISANREICAAYIEKSLALTTNLVPYTGHDRAAALAKTELVDRYLFFVAPKLLGGDKSTPVTWGTSWLLGKETSLDFVKVERVGPDVLLVAEPRAKRR